MVSYNDNWSVNKWCSSIQPIPNIQTSPEIRIYMITFMILSLIVLLMFAGLSIKATDEIIEFYNRKDNK
jgi:hypothetical protein